ncbi:hypothetical protein IP86_06710 [Rhodopseudomonas sp. AAP120]|uniref:DUF2239 family protein n=1 Tax=Rhodopseudomonas sp. AAP120 TaxID=1523430 RepID=UPI0006B99310|nr:DUF2239 family protein [Rhodopseudomonas sp. AAP120]KPG00503.1 hypothetical protein IP86_06710 [Rhodopseudomonas sp. AAP120]
MNPNDVPSYVAFQGERLLAEGDLRSVVAAIKPLVDRGEAGVLVFGAASQQVDFDLRGSLAEVLARLPADESVPEPVGDEVPRGRGRPKLGVVAREVTLLPRHWEWLGQQRGGASVALRRLVDEARHASADTDRVRAAQEATHRFMTVMAGDRPDYEEAARALFAGDSAKFARCTQAWPVDIRDHARRLAGPAWPSSG